MAEKRLEDMLWRNIRQIRSENDEQFARWVLEARSDFLRLRLRQEPALRKIYVDAADNVAEEIRNLKPTIGELTRNHLSALEKSLRREAEQISQGVAERLKDDMLKAVEAGASSLNQQLIRAIQESKAPLDLLKIQRGFADVNSAAVEALWSRTHKGMMLSDRIWQASDNAQQAIRDIIWDGTARGRDAVKVARDLEKYVRHGAKTLADDYPDMMDRMGRRIPKNLSYEALRLARTEMSNALREGTYAAGRTNPSYKGVRWMLSSSHPIPDICDDFASADLYGLGPGGYPTGEEPPIAHPQCLCYTVPLVEDTGTFVDRLVSWTHDPSSDPELEQWYNDIYRGKFGQTVTIRVTSRPTQPVQQVQTVSKHRVELPDLPDAAKDGLATAFETALEHGEKAGTEILITIDSETGEEFYPAIPGDENSVRLPGTLIDKLIGASRDSVIVIHNHPSSSAFSAEDLQVASYYNSISWAAVVGHDGTRYAVRVGNGRRPMPTDIKSLWVDAIEVDMEYYRSKVISGEMTNAEAFREHSNKAMQALAKRLGWDYWRFEPDG